MIGVIYSIASGQVREIHVPDQGEPLVGRILKRGEGFMRIKTPSRDLATIRDVVSKSLGKPLQSSACAVIDGSGIVRSVIQADPTCDDVPGYFLVPVTGDARIGSTYNFSSNTFSD